MRTVELGKTGEKIPILGQGTWGIKSGKKKEFYDGWRASLRKGIELGINHIDTAEFYGFGVSERLVGEIIAENKRDDLFITSKLFPMHIRYKTMLKAADKSLKRLGINNFDLYLIHWPNKLIPVKRQMKLLEELVNQGKTRYIGVSNFSVDLFKKGQEELKREELTTNQVIANVKKQKHIHNSLPYYQEEKITMTAYSPLGHKGLAKISNETRTKLESIAKKHNATIHQIAIAWLINHENVITIPKAFQIKHVEANAKAADIKFTQDELKILYENPL